MSARDDKLARCAHTGASGRTGARALTGAPELARVAVHGMTREAFIVRGALAAGAAYGLAAVGPYVHGALAQTGAADADVARFALTLELLESQYYEQALAKTPTLGGDTRAVAREIRDNELEHVDTLQQLITQLGGNAARSLAVDFGDNLSSEAKFLRLAQSFEETGVSAYNGSAPQIVSKDVLETMGEIVQVEGRHAAVIRFIREDNIATSAFDESRDMAQVQQLLKPYLRRG